MKGSARQAAVGRLADRFSPAGERFFGEIGIESQLCLSNTFMYRTPALDWSVRSRHLASAAGAALLDRCYALGAAQRVQNSRVVIFASRERTLDNDSA